MVSFSQLNCRAPISNIDPSPAGAKKYLRETITQTLSLYDRGTSRWKLLPQDLIVAEAIIGRSRLVANQLASNMGLRRALGSLLIDLLGAMQNAHPRRRFFLVTLISDRWLSFDLDTYIWLGGMQNTVRPVMALGGFTGWFGMIEVQTLDETVRGLGRILMPHAHAVAWSDDPRFCPEEAEGVMRASKRLISRIGAATVDVSYREDTSACNLGAYIMKAAAVAKFREPCRYSPSGLKLSDTALPPVSAVRQVEVLSEMYFDELMLSGGDGTYLRRELKLAMLNILPSRETSVESAAAHWDRVRARSEQTARYARVDIDNTGRQLPPDSPISLASARWTGARTGRAI